MIFLIFDIVVLDLRGSSFVDPAFAGFHIPFGWTPNHFRPHLVDDSLDTSEVSTIVKKSFSSLIDKHLGHLESDGQARYALGEDCRGLRLV